jgi:hypothetical protein
MTVRITELNVALGLVLSFASFRRYTSLISPMH